MHLLRTKLLLARLLTVAMLVAIAVSPFGRAPLGAIAAPAGHAHCPGHASDASNDAGAKAAVDHREQGHAHGTMLAQPTVDEAAKPNPAAPPAGPTGDPGCCLTAVGVQQPALVTPLPIALTAQRLAAPLDDAAVADLTPDGPQRPPRTRDHA